MLFAAIAKRRSVIERVKFIPFIPPKYSYGPRNRNHQHMVTGDDYSAATRPSLRTATTDLGPLDDWWGDPLGMIIKRCPVHRS